MHLRGCDQSSSNDKGPLEIGNKVSIVPVLSVKVVVDSGLYTVVTDNEFLIVNGIFVSPFETAHLLVHNSYNIHRIAYQISDYLELEACIHFIFSTYSDGSMRCGGNRWLINSTLSLSKRGEEFDHLPQDQRRRVEEEDEEEEEVVVGVTEMEFHPWNKTD